MNTKTPKSYVSCAIVLCIIALLATLPSPMKASAPPLCAVPTPIVEYKFNDAGPAAPSTGPDTTPVTFKTADGNPVDLHGAAGSGVSGTGGDLAFDNSNPAPSSDCGDFGLGGCGGRAEQPGDDDYVDGLASMTLQGWIKSSDPASVTGNSGRLFDKNDGFAPPGNGGFFLGWNAGIIDLQIKNNSTLGGAASPASYFSGNQWMFFAVTYDGTSSTDNVKFYRGTSAQSVELVGTATMDLGAIADAAIPLNLGNGANGLRAFAGLLDNMRIFGSTSAASGALTIDQLESVRVRDLFPVPIVEYTFNESGTTAASTGSDPTPAIFRDSDNNETDLHGSAGSGVSGLTGDIAFDNTDPATPSYPCAIGLGGCGGRGEQPVDDENVDAFTSITIQGWMKSDDPTSVTGNGGRWVHKADGGAQPGGAGGYTLGWNVGAIDFSLIGTSGGSGNVVSSPFYYSNSQWIFFAVTYDGTSNGDNVKFYRGSSAESVELTDIATIDAGQIKGTIDHLTIGNGSNAIRAFPGLFDNVRVYGSPSSSSGVLSIAQLEALRNADLLNVDAPIDESDPDGDGIINGCDATPPVITPTVVGTLGNAGWYVSNVSTTWAVVEPESLISSQTGCGPTATSSDTAGLTLTCSATSDGGTSSQSVSFKRDATPPTAAAAAAPPANSFGWRKTNVTVSFSGTDALSGGVTCDPQIVLSSQGAGQSATGRCLDAAGNQSAPATINGVNIDKTNPTATVSTPISGAAYTRNQTVIASYSCSDALSGAASCIGPVVSGQAIDTSKKVNNGKFTVTATDKAGNTSKTTVTYSVR